MTNRETIYFNRNHRQKIFFSFLPPLTIQARGLNNLVSRTTVCRGGEKMRRKGWKLRDKTRSGGVFFTRGGSTLSSKIMRCVSSGPWKSEPKGKKKNTRRTRVTNHLDPLEYTFYSSFLFHVPRDLSQWCFVTGSNFFYFFFFLWIKICIILYSTLLPTMFSTSQRKSFSPVDKSMRYVEGNIRREENISVVPIFIVQGG